MLDDHLGAAIAADREGDIAADILAEIIEQAALLVAFEPIVREVFERRCRKMKVEDVAGELKISRSPTNRSYRTARDALRRLLEGRIREGDLHP